MSYLGILGFRLSFLKFVKGAALSRDFVIFHRPPRSEWAINVIIKAQIQRKPGSEVESPPGPIVSMFHIATVLASCRGSNE